MGVVRFAIPLVAALVFAAGCSSSSGSGSGSGSAPSAADHDVGRTTFAFGEPGDPAAVDRMIEVTQVDDPGFEPSSLMVQAGETIRFEVTNTGHADHEFVLGDTAAQEAHEAEMSEMGGEMMADEPNALSVEPGSTESLVWTFSRSGTVLYGCHVAGHYASGMVGQVHVDS
jgi:uncharacterized cupredoxin-like copper-binding protein